MLTEGEASPARTPWSADNTFVRSRFIVKRLKRMRSKTKSLTEDVSGSYLYHSPESSSLPFEPSLSYESLPSPREEDEHFQCCSQEKSEQDLTVEDIVKDIVHLSMRNKHRLREEKVSFEEESVQPLSCKGSPKSTAEIVLETEGGARAAREDELTTLVTASESEPEPQFSRCQGINLLEEFEEALPKEYSLKRALFCFYSVTMYRALLRLSRVPFQVTSKQSTQKTFKNKEAEDCIEKELMRLEVELMVQKMLLEQATKALEFSTLTRSHQQQHLEAEKALLMASIKFEAVQKEMERLLKKPDEDLEAESGFASIKDFTVTVEKPSAWSSYTFTLVAVERDNVKGSDFEVISQEGLLHFEAPFHFHKLKPDFIIFISLYGISMKDPKFRFFHRSNERLPLLHKTAKTQKWISAGPGHNFTLLGSTEIQLFNIKQMEIIPLKGTPNMSRTQTVKLRGEVYLDTLHVGFLDVRHVQRSDEESSVWTRYWFRLTGLEMEGWPYPSQQTIETPAYCISLKKCSSSAIEPVSPFFCARPNTFSFTLEEDEGEKQQVLCATDTHEEMAAWCRQLNNNIRSYRAWNLI